MADRETPTEQKAEGKWKKFKGRLQQAWGDLTDDELDKFEGKRKELEGHIAEKTGESRQEVRERLDKLAKKSGY